MSNFTSSYERDGSTLIFSLSSYEREVDKWKNSLNVTVWMSVNPHKLILLHRFLRTSYNSMSWGMLPWTLVNT